MKTPYLLISPENTIVKTEQLTSQQADTLNRYFRNQRTGYRWVQSIEVTP